MANVRLGRPSAGTAGCGRAGLSVLLTAFAGLDEAVGKEFASVGDALGPDRGTHPELLSGEEEARTTFLGAVSDLAAPGPRLVVDIGGGSTELILGQVEPTALVSLDIGCVRMFEKHLLSDPPAPHELVALRAEGAGRARDRRDPVARPTGVRLIGVAGTVTQLATLRAGMPAYDPDLTHHAVSRRRPHARPTARIAALRQEGSHQGIGAGPDRCDRRGGRDPSAGDGDVPRSEVLTSEKDILDGLVPDLLANVLG